MQPTCSPCTCTCSPANTGALAGGSVAGGVVAGLLAGVIVSALFHRRHDSNRGTRSNAPHHETVITNPEFQNTNSQRGKMTSSEAYGEVITSSTQQSSVYASATASYDYVAPNRP